MGRCGAVGAEDGEIKGRHFCWEFWTEYWYLTISKDIVQRLAGTKHLARSETSF